MSLVDKIIAARAALLTMAPFFGVLATRLQIVEDKACKTLWSDSKSLGFNPAYVESLTKLEIQAILCKIVMQLSAGHAWRMGARDAKLWNQASTLAVLPALEDMALVYPGTMKSRPEFKGMTAEGIFLTLLEEQEHKKPPPPPSPSSKPESAKADKGEGKPDEGEKESLSDSTCDSGSSSSEDACTEEGESPSPADNSKDEPGEIRPIAADEADEREAEWDSAVKHAAAQQGNLPGSLVLMLKDALVKPLPWKQELQHFARKLKGRTHYSFSRPNRNYLHKGMILPAKVPRPRLGTVVIARDTSGSIACSDYLGMFNAAIQDLLKVMNPERIVVLDVDTHVRKVQSVMPDRHEKLDGTAAGGGGTRFEPAFDWVETEKIPDVACLLYLTDMMGSFPRLAPKYPVLWVKTDLVMSRHLKAPFGKELVLTAA